MKSGQRCFSVIVMAMLAFSSVLMAGEPQALRVGACKKAPKIDGALDDPCWKSAARAEDFMVFNTGKKATVPTTALVTCDNDNLYLAFTCSEPTPDKLAVYAKERDGAMGNDDSVEIFIRPGGEVYYHFILNSANVKGDRRASKGDKDANWNGEWRSATKTEADKWTAEIAVPFSDFGNDMVTGKKWGLNLCRNRRLMPAETSSWTYMPKGFHQPADFGLMTGVAGKSVDGRILVRELKTANFVSEPDSKYSYETIVKLQNLMDEDAELQVEATDILRNGKKTSNASRITLSSWSIAETHIKLIFDRMAPRSVSLRVKDAKTGEVYCQETISNVDCAKILDVFPDRSYYTTEGTANVMAVVNMDNMESLRVQTRLNSSAQPESNVTADGATVLPIDIANLRPGEYEVTVTLSDSQKNTLAERKLTLKKMPPANKRSVIKIDHENQSLLMNGKPFFPVGFFLVPQNRLEEAARIGCNTVIAWHQNVSLKEGREYLDAAGKVGIKVIESPTLRYFGKGVGYFHPYFKGNFEKAVNEKLPEVLEALKDHPALIAWYNSDEPNLAKNSVTSSGKSIEALCADYRRKVNQLDPYHPVITLFAGSIPGNPEWQETYDVPSIDAYWFPLRGDTPKKPALKTRDAVKIASRTRAPFVLALQSTMVSASNRSLKPDEQRCSTYLGLINGAKGMVYFNYFVVLQSMWEEQIRLINEMNRLAPILLKAAPKQEITVEPANLANSIQVLAKRYQGKLYLIAANAESAEIRAEFNIPGLKAENANVWFENRKTDIKNSTLVDTFRPYGTHVYEMERAPGGKIEMGLTLKIAPVKAAAIPAEEFKQPKNNLIKNPGFEQPGGWKFSDWSKTKGNRGIIEEGNARKGKKCAAIHRSHFDAYAQYVSDWFKIEPMKKYRLGAAIKCDVSEGLEGPTVFLLNKRWKMIGGQIRLEGKSVHNPSGEIDWKEYDLRFTSTFAEEQVQVYCRFPKAKGTVWFDDVFLEELSEDEVINLVRNSSFEKGLPRWPSYWQIIAPRAIRDNMPRIGEPGSLWEADDKVAYHGKQSLRLIWPRDLKNCRMGTQMGLRIPVQGGETYSVSAYMKANRPGVKVRIFIQDSSFQNKLIYRDVTLTRSWRRYSVVGALPFKQTIAVPRFDMLSPGTVWIDAVQFETGDINEMEEEDLEHPYVPDQ